MVVARTFPRAAVLWSQRELGAEHRVAAGGDGGLLDVDQTHLAPHCLQLSRRIERPEKTARPVETESRGGIPQHPKVRLSPKTVPHAGRHHASRSHNPAHLGDSGARVGQEHQNEL